jgi:uncharacterized protein YacL
MGVRIVGFVFSFVFALGTGLIGFAFSSLWMNTKYVRDNLPSNNYWWYVGILLAVLGLILGFSLGNRLYRRMLEIGQGLKRIPAEDKIASILGTIFGLVPAYLVGLLFSGMTFFQEGPQVDLANGTTRFALVLLSSVLIIWFMNLIFLSMKDELKFLMPGMSARNAAHTAAPQNGGAPPKLLDTNVIIDGRIYDICRSGFLDGPLILVGFVLEELHHIADSSDALRRNRGRRGLDILHQMQTELDSVLRVVDRYKVSFAPGDGVDIKLVKLAKAMHADIVTNDFNLNKVAKLHGVRVLNVNELANAVKPVVLPGEEMTITVIKEGKEYNQGVGYLDDGTMVVVENGKKMLGDQVTVSVSSVLQTVAGKMIFAELKYEGEPQEHAEERNGYPSGRGSRRKTV